MPYTRPYTFVNNSEPALSAANLNDLQDDLGAYARGVVPVINAKDNAVANATGNGSTDDRAALQAIINSLATTGGQVFLPAGDYFVGTPGLVWPNVRYGITLRGAGMGAVDQQTTRLKRNGAYSLVAFTTDGTNPTSGVSFVDLAFFGGNQNATLIDMHWLDNSQFVRCRFWQSTARLIYGRALWNVHFTDCYFAEGGAIGSLIPAVEFTSSSYSAITSGCNTVLLANCEWEANTGTDLLLDGSSSPSRPCVGVEASNCKFERGDGHAVHFKYSHSNGVYNSYVLGDSNSNASVRFDEPDAYHGSNRCVGNGLVVAGSPMPYHVQCSSSGSQAVVVGNTIYGSNATAAMSLESGYGSVMISGNSLVDWSGSKLMVTDARTTKKGTVQRTNGGLVFYDALSIKSKAGAPADGDFEVAPAPAAASLVWDDTNNVLYVRKPGGTYRQIATT